MVRIEQLQDLTTVICNDHLRVELYIPNFHSGIRGSIDAIDQLACPLYRDLRIKGAGGDQADEVSKRGPLLIGCWKWG